MSRFIRISLLASVLAALAAEAGFAMARMPPETSGQTQTNPFPVKPPDASSTETASSTSTLRTDGASASSYDLPSGGPTTPDGFSFVVPMDASGSYPGSVSRGSPPPAAGTGSGSRDPRMRSSGSEGSSLKDYNIKAPEVGAGCSVRDPDCGKSRKKVSATQ